MEIRWATHNLFDKKLQILQGWHQQGCFLGSLFSDPGSILRQRIIPLYKSFESRPNSSKSSSLLWLRSSLVSHGLFRFQFPSDKI